jgi:RimJ/RimL family protein N-acetyltransferase
MDPMSVDVPEEILSDRLALRAPHPDYAEAVRAAVIESLPELRVFMPWAQQEPTLEFQREWSAESRKRFMARSELNYMLFERDGGALVGACGVPGLDWSIPKFEIGYWVRSSRARRGYITEAVGALTRVAFEQLGARRVEIRMSSQNLRSSLVAQRLGFKLEGVLRHDGRHPDGTIRDTLVFARIDPA